MVVKGDYARNVTYAASWRKAMSIGERSVTEAAGSVSRMGECLLPVALLKSNSSVLLCLDSVFRTDVFPER